MDYVDGLSDSWAISQVTALELIVGARDKREVATIDAFLSPYPVVQLGEAVGTRAYALLKLYAKSSRAPRLRFSDCGDRHGNRPRFGHAQSKALSDDWRSEAPGARVFRKREIVKSRLAGTDSLPSHRRRSLIPKLAIAQQDDRGYRK